MRSPRMLDGAAPIVNGETDIFLHSPAPGRGRRRLPGRVSDPPAGGGRRDQVSREAIGQVSSSS